MFRSNDCSCDPQQRYLSLQEKFSHSFAEYFWKYKKYVAEVRIFKLEPREDDHGGGSTIEYASYGDQELIGNLFRVTTRQKIYFEARSLRKCVTK